MFVLKERKVNELKRNKCKLNVENNNTKIAIITLLELNVH